MDTREQAMKYQICEQFDYAGTRFKVLEICRGKIDLADEVLILNVGGYIGSSTRSELEYARAHSKPVRFLEPEAQS